MYIIISVHFAMGLGVDIGHSRKVSEPVGANVGLRIPGFMSPPLSVLITDRAETGAGGTTELRLCPVFVFGFFL